MADTPKSGDPVTPATPSNEPSPSGTPAPTEPVKTDDGEVERLRKEIAQRELRERQLANELEAERKAKAEAEADKLKENEEFKTLYEQSEAKLKAYEAEQEEAKTKAELKSAEDEILGEYDEAVRKEAKELGFSLTDTTDESKTILKNRLDKIKGMVSNERITPNNPAPNQKAKPSFENDKGVIEGEVQGSKFDEIVAQMPGIASMMGGNEE